VSIASFCVSARSCWWVTVWVFNCYVRLEVVECASVAVGRFQKKKEAIPLSLLLSW
jgi:hypothetical protein